jgi:tRNA threonylcarbamoyladenosine biosynthesis protein TsaE
VTSADAVTRWRGTTSTSDATRDVARALAGTLTAGDVVVLTGPLGAGKTTFVQGMAAGLGVTGPVTSPTFVLARELRGGRVPVIHVDAYRIGSALELDHLDLDADVASAVVAVEWGEGLAERLADSRLEVHLDREDDGRRTIEVRACGPRWLGVDLGLPGRPGHRGG